MATSSSGKSAQDFLAPLAGASVNLAAVNPIFAQRMQALINAAEAATGQQVTITSGYRSPQHQAQIYANYTQRPVVYDGKTYTPNGTSGIAARPGKSQHQQGFALDIAPRGAAYQWMTRHAPEFGIEWGGTWRGSQYDPPHFQLPRSENASALAGTLDQPKTVLASVGHPVPPADIPSGTAPPIPLDRPAFRSPAAPGGNAGDSLAFSPVNVSMADQLPLVFDSGSDYGRMPQFANASGSPTDRDEASAARLNAALAWLSGGRNEPAAAAAPKDGLSTALDWLSGGRDSGQPYGSSALTQAQRNAMLAVPETPPPLPIADPRLTPVTPMDRPATAIAATAPASSTPAPQLVNVNGHTYEVGSILQAAGRSYQVNADGTFSKMPSISLGTNTIASGMVGQALNDAIKTAQTEAPAILSSAAGKIGSIFGNLFSGNNGAPVPPLDVPRTISALPSTFPDRPTVVAPNTRPAAPVSTFPDRPTVIAPNTTPASHPATVGDRAGELSAYNWASPYYSAALADSPASSKGYGGYIPGGMPSGDDTQKSLRPATADPLDLGVTQTVTQMVPVTKTTYQTKQSLNPTYSAWLKDQNSAIYGVPDVESPSLDANGNVVLPDSYLGAAPRAKPAPPKYITTRVPVTTRALVQRQVAAPMRPVAPAAPASTPAIAAALTAARMPVVARNVLSAPQAANYLNNPQLQAEYPNPVVAAVTGAANPPVGSIAAPSTGGVISPFHSF